MNRIGRILAALMIGLVLVAAAVFALWRLAAPAFLERAVMAALAERGIAVEHLEVASLTRSRARIVDLALAGPGAPRIAAAEAVFDLHGLLQDGRIERLEVEGLALTLTVDADGRLAVAGLSAGDAGAGMPELPVDRIVVRNGRLRLRTPWGDGTARIDGAATTRDGLRADLQVTEAELSRAGWSADGIDGWVAAAMGSAGLAHLDGQFTIDRAALSGAMLGDAVVQFGAGDRPPWALVRAATADGNAALRLDVGLDGGDVTVDAVVEARDLAELAAVHAPDLPVAGRGKLMVSLQADLEALRSGWPGAVPSAFGTAALRIANGSYGDRLAAIDGVIDGTLALEGTRLVLSGTTPWRLRGSLADFGMVALTLDRDGGTAQRLVLDIGSAAALSGAYAVEAAAATYAGTVDATIAEGVGEAPAIAVERMTLSGGPVRLADIDGTVEALTVSGGGTADAFSGRVAGSVELSGTLPGNVRVEEAVVAGTGAVTLAGGELRFTPDGCVSLVAGRLALGDVLSAPDGLELCAGPRAKAPFLKAALVSPVEIAVAASTAATAIRLATRAGGPEVAEARLPALHLAAVYAGGAFRIDGRAADGRLVLADPGYVLDGIGGTFAIDPAADDGGRIDWWIDSAASTATLLPVVPLRLTGTARIGEPMVFEGRGLGGQGAVMLAFDGRQDAEGGHVDFRLDPVTFAPGVRQPPDVFPALAPLQMTGVSGLVSATGRYGWGEQAGSHADIVLQGVSFATPAAAVSGLSAELHAGSLAPFVLPPGQRVTAAGLDIGIPLENGTAVFGLSADRRLSVTELGFDWAGGRLGAEPFTASLSDPTHAVVLRAGDIDLAQLLTSFPLADLSVTGRLDGRVPVRLADDTIIIEDAILETTGPGIIRYTPAEPPGGRQGEAGVALLLDALRNFHYDSVAVHLDGRTGQDMAARLEIRGSNPDLYDGYPIALNVNVTGALADILRQGLETTGYAERLEEFFRARLRPGANDDLIEDIESIQE